MVSKAKRPAGAAAADLLQVERLGGFPGYGLPGAALRSHGELQLAQLSPAERAAVAHWFAHPPAPETRGNDNFTYRLTRQGVGGTQVVDVPAAQVPAALRDCVKDALI